MLITMLRTQ